ncbi:MAG: hypothetical protein EOO73_17870 [Myxococcales bacterium]|nr:MAG: hypothetical protein EOO73_17870 [Myxococcales bacterium]
MLPLGVRFATFTSALALASLAAFSAKAMPVRGGELRVQRSEVATDCPDEQALSAWLAAIEGSAPPAAGSPLKVEVELDRDDAGYVARIRSSGGKSGERELRDSGDDCTPLAYATSVALAILFDSSPERAEDQRREPAAFATAPARASRDDSAARVYRAVTPAPDAARGASWPTASLEVSAGVGAGMLGYTITAQAAVSLRLRASRRWFLRAGALWLPGRELPHGPGVGTVQLVAGRADVTATVSEVPRGRLGLSAGLGVGSLSGAGLGYDHDYAVSALWLAPAVGAVGNWGLSPGGALSLSITLLVPHRTQRFSVASVRGIAFESAPAAALLELGAELFLL